MILANAMSLAQTRCERLVVLAQFCEHVFRLDILGVIVQHALQPGDVADRSDCQTSCLANALSNGIRHCEDLIGMFVQQQMIVPEVWPAHVPVEVLSLQIKSEYIGEDCVLHAHASIRERVHIGNRVVVQDGAVVGSDGFGFATNPDGTHHKIPQIGAVVIEDDVEIGANATIDRPAVGETRIGAGTKIDNLVQVAHGVMIGQNVLLAAQVGIAGSTTIEDSVTLAGQVGVSGHITVGKGTIATAQTGIPNSVDPGSFISGYPAISNRDWLKSSAVFRKLPELRKAIADLDARLAEVEARLK